MVRPQIALRQGIVVRDDELRIKCLLQSLSATRQVLFPPFGK